jgi:Flp pilus assembly protein TadG
MFLSSCKNRAVVGIAASIGHAAHIKLASFKDDRGTVAMIFGLVAMAIVLFVGAAVDMGRWLHAHSHTKAAVDSAVLAGARTLQVTGGDTAAALLAARSYYKSNVQKRIKVMSDTIDFVVGGDNKSVTAEGTAYIRTPFLGIARIKRLALWNDSGAEAASASSEIGSGTDQQIEISIMLDTTGSMQGQKLTDLKAAAKDLLDIMLAEGRDNVRIALAPFAESVRPGTYLSQVRGSRSSTVRVRDSSGRQQTYALTSCVSERTGSDAYTDASPDASRVGAVYTRSGNCTPGASIVPLTTDKARLTATINGLTASGTTAGHIGTAWAWYLLSPNWSNVWTGGSTPGSYDDTNVRKIAILMTDGEYNTQYDAAGILTSVNSTNPVNGYSNNQARTLCSGMKESGIEVYTVGFALDNANAIETLEQCATSDSTSYLAEDGAQLRNVFRDIAIKLSPLHLTN